MHVFREKGDLAFRSERELRDQVALNLSLLEPGLRLYDVNGLTGIEYPAGAGLRIDILAIDSTDSYVVCELKAGEGQAEAVGQILKYMTWVRLNLSPRHRKVRGLIICSEVSEGLQLASADIPSLSILRYGISLRFDPSPRYEQQLAARLAAWPPSSDNTRRDSTVGSRSTRRRPS